MTESGGGAEDSELRRRRRKRRRIYLLIFAVFQTSIIILLSQTVMKIRSPKFRVDAAAFGAFAYSSGAASPSFDIAMYAELSVKNGNFGGFKFESTAVYFYYEGAVVGSAFVPAWQAGARSTRTVRVEVQLSSAAVLDRVHLAGDLEGGVLPLNIRSRMSGEVKVLVLKRDKEAMMECFLAINLVQRTLGYLTCD